MEDKESWKGAETFAFCLQMDHGREGGERERELDSLIKYPHFTSLLYVVHVYSWTSTKCTTLKGYFIISLTGHVNSWTKKEDSLVVFVT